MAPLMGVNLHVASVIQLALGIIILYFPLQVIYNLYFHPLRKYPGPLLHRATTLGYAIKMTRGKMIYEVAKMHEKYGPVVRIAPNSLSFIDADAWRDIYGHRIGSLAGTEEMSKDSRFYLQPGQPVSIIAETKENHAVLRRQLAHGFSERAMRQQEPIIGSYVDLLIRRMREHCSKPRQPSSSSSPLGPAQLDIKSWYNWTTFDVIGDLAFGEPFGCLENTEYHPWVKVVGDMARFMGFVQAVKIVGLMQLLRVFVQLKLWGSREKHFKYTRAKIDRRTSLTMERPDLIEGLLKLKNLEMDRLQANASTLIIAGSETTATLLSGVTYLLLANPDKLEKLKQEVRSSFEDEREITLLSVAKLDYMLACLDEALRRYPPVAIGMPRRVPKGGANICGRAIPEDTTVAVWQYAAYTSEANFEDPFSYKPERFLAKEENGISPEEKKRTRDNFDVLQPFSFGPRNCIGKNLAYAEMRLILAKVLYNFDLELVDKDSNWLDHKAYVLWDKPPLNVYVTPVH